VRVVEAEGGRRGRRVVGARELSAVLWGGKADGDIFVSDCGGGGTPPSMTELTSPRCPLFPQL